MPHATINGRRIHHRDTGGDGTAVVLAHGCLMDREDLTDRLGEITCPALVVHGTEDTAISMERADAPAAALVGADPVVRVGGAHAASLTNPEPVSATILGFLAGLPD